jgi:putative colanic acid biosynthesis acetyltransferase WcaB
MNKSNMSFRKFVLQDWAANKHNTKGRIVTLCFRVANYGRCSKTARYLLLPYRVFYTLLFEWLLGIEIKYQTVIGAGLRIFHIQAIVINQGAVIGENCTLRQSITIGNKVDGGQCPVIGNNVNIGAQVCILGDITIGDNVNIGAGSIVVKSVQPNCTVAGNPSRIIKSADNLEIIKQ